MINAGSATIICNPDNVKVSIMNYDAVTPINELEDFEDMDDVLQEEDNYQRDSVGCYYQEQGNI